MLKAPNQNKETKKSNISDTNGMQIMYMDAVSVFYTIAICLGSCEFAPCSSTLHTPI